MPKIDLRAPIISAERKVWRLFPGGGYKFLDQFRSDSVAFLDLPGLRLPPFPLTQSKELPRRIRESEIILEKIAKEGKDRIPTVSEQELISYRVGKRRTRNLQAIVNFFERAQKDDLVVTPDKLSHGRILVGRFEDDPKLAHFNVVAARSYGLTPICLMIP